MNNRNNRETAAVFGLILAALFWGISYPLTKFVEACPTFYIISIRFAVAAVIIAFFARKKFAGCSRELIKNALILSVVITSMYIFNILGVKYTTAVRASFFTTLSFLIVPVMNLILYKVRISRTIFFSAAICLAGIYMLCYRPDGIGFSINLGDFLCFLASIAGSINIIYIEKMSRDTSIDNTLFMTFLMAFVSLWGTVIALIRGDLAYGGASAQELLVILIMGIFCSAGAFILQIHSEKHVSSNRVGIIFALEPASGCILSVLILRETMSAVGWAGACVIILSIIFMELSVSRDQKRRIKETEHES